MAHTYLIQGAFKDSAKSTFAYCRGDTPAEAEREASERGILATTTTLYQRDINVVTVNNVHDETPTEAYLRLICYWVRFWSRLILAAAVIAILVVLVPILFGRR